MTTVKRYRTRLQMIKELEEILSNLPVQVIADILSRLPIKTIIQCRCVSKPWLDLLSSPYFYDLHLSKAAPPACSLLVATNNFGSNPCPRDFYLCCGLGRNMLSSLGTELKLPCSEVDIVGSFNGLVCLFERSKGIVYICNPILREYIEIPGPTIEELGAYRLMPSGFCYDSGTNVYKVVLTIKSVTRILTIGSDNMWRKVDHVPKSIERGEHTISLNGGLHWVSIDNNNSNTISCLDIKQEQVRSIPVPDMLSKESVRLGVLKNLLCLCHGQSYIDLFDLWVMEEYGIKGSWRKLYVLEGSLFTSSRVVPITVLDDGCILLIAGYEDDLFSFNPRSMQTRRLKVDQRLARHGFDIFPYTLSFLSVKNVLNTKECSRVLKVK